MSVGKVGGQQDGSQFQNVRSLRDQPDVKKSDEQFQVELKKLFEDLLKTLDTKSPGAQKGGPSAQGASAPAPQQAGGGAAPTQQAGSPSQGSEAGGDIDELLEKLKRMMKDPRAEEALGRLAAENPSLVAALSKVSAALSDGGGASASGGGGGGGGGAPAVSPS